MKNKSVSFVCSHGILLSPHYESEFKFFLSRNGITNIDSSYTGIGSLFLGKELSRESKEILELADIIATPLNAAYVNHALAPYHLKGKIVPLNDLFISSYFNKEAMFQKLVEMAQEHKSQTILETANLQSIHS